VRGSEIEPSTSASPLFFFSQFLYIRRCFLHDPVQTMVVTMTYYANSSTADTDTTARASLWHRIRFADSDKRTSFLFWLTVFGLGCISLFTVTWMASFALSAKGSEKLLQVSLILPKLKSNQGDRKAAAFRMSEPEPSELAHPTERKTLAPGSVMPAVIDHPKGTIAEVPHHVGPAAATPEPPSFASLQPFEIAIPPDGPPPIVETCHDPVVFLHPCPSPRGDSPMMRNWKMLTMYSLLSAAAVSLAPPPVVAFAEDPKKEPAKVLDEKALKEISEAIRAELKKFEEGPLTKLDGKVEEIKTSVGTLKTDVAGLQAEQNRQKLQIEQQKMLIDLLAKKLEAAPSTPTVDKDFVEAMKGIKEVIARLAPAKERTMMSPPETGAASTGRVMLVNFYDGELLFIINGATHRVPGGSWKAIENFPAGPVNVEVAADRFGLFNRQVATLAPGKTYTLTATPQR
jgi:hypothetical protein